MGSGSGPDWGRRRSISVRSALVGLGRAVASPSVGGGREGKWRIGMREEIAGVGLLDEVEGTRFELFGAVIEFEFERALMLFVLALDEDDAEELMLRKD